LGLGVQGNAPRRVVSAEQVALIPKCAECSAVWLPAYTEQTSNPLLPGSGGVNPPELVCK
jgi:hypothetical protein